MRKYVKMLLLGCTVISAGALAMGITYAAYVAPDETNTFEFGTMSASNATFQSLSYYFDGGDGETEGTSLIVKNSQQLRNLSKLQNAGYFAAGKPWVKLATSFQYEDDGEHFMEPIGTIAHPFTGVFNGQDNLITNLKISTAISETVSETTYAYVGMFGVIGTTSNTGTVRNLVLSGPEILYTGSASTVKLGVAVGKKNTSGSTSVVQNIEVYGGTSLFKPQRVHIRSSVAVTGGDGIVGEGGSATSSFVASISKTPAYAASPTYTSGFTAGENYHLWNNDGTVTNSN